MFYSYGIKFLTVLYATVKLLKTAYLQGDEKDGENDLLAITWTPITKVKPSCCGFLVF